MSRLLRTIVIFVGCFAGSTGWAQSPSAFQDVPKDHWAYKSLGRLQDSGFIPGYPAGQFTGARTLTRYEIALAVDRAARSMPCLRVGNSPGSQFTLRDATSDELVILKRLVREFRAELQSQGSPPSSVGALEAKIDIQLVRLSPAGAGPSLKPTTLNLSGSPNAASPLAVRSFVYGSRDTIRIGQSQPGRLTLSDSFKQLNSPVRLGLFDAAINPDAPVSAPSFTVPLGSSGSPNITLGNAIPNPSTLGVLRLDTSPTAASACLDPTYVSDGLRLSGTIGGVTSEVFSARLRTVHSGALDLSPAAAAGIPALDPGLATSLSDNRVTGVSLGIGVRPFGQSGNIKLNVLNVNGDVSQGRTGLDSAVVLGTNADFSLGGKLTLSADLGRTISGLRSDDILGSSDASAYNLRLGFLSGGLHISAGYRYIDPLYYAPGYWGQIGSWLNPTNVQGPSVRAGFDFGRSVGVRLGGDFYSAARERAQTGVLGPNDDVSRLLVGLRWDVSRNFHTTVDWEGVYWTLSGPHNNLPTLGGGTFHPTERYITLGTGYNLTRNMLFKLTYQVGDFNGQGLFSNSIGKFTYNAIAGQAAVKF